MYRLLVVALLFAFSFVLQAYGAERSATYIKAQKDVEDVGTMLRKTQKLDQAMFDEIRMQINIQARLTVEAAKCLGENTAELESRLNALEKDLHERNVSRVIVEMETFAKLPIDSDSLSQEVDGLVWSWRFAFLEAREKGVVIPMKTEVRRKELEMAAYELAAMRALKEYRDFIDCKSSRFASAGTLSGTWRVWERELHYQTLMPIRVAVALETPKSRAIELEHDRLKNSYSEKFYGRNSGAFLGSINYEHVCGKTRNQYEKNKK
jgi:hypothetical protein